MTDEQITKEAKTLLPDINEDVYGGSFGFMRWLAAAGEVLPPWWSPERDRQLRILTKNSDQLSGANNMMQEMIGAIPFKVVPLDRSIKSHRRDAEEMTYILSNFSESRSSLVDMGWLSFLSPFISDVDCTDNGAWAVVEGDSDKDGLLIGKPTKLVHLDSYNCWRTRSRDYPLVYTDADGARYKVHRSRVINITSSLDPSIDMYGVGFCAVSRATNYMQRLMDISTFYQEKMGSRPPRGFLFITGTGSEKAAKAIENGVFIANERMDNKGLSRYSEIPVIGMRDGNVQLISISQLPDGFNEMTTVQIGVWILSLAFGVDSRQLGFALGVAGQTKADAEIQHLKMQGKFPGWFIQKLTKQINYKFLPRGLDRRPYLEIIFDQQDDSQDLAQAEQRKIRSEYRKTYTDTGLWPSWMSHQDMLATGDITEEQFAELEQGEGRLEDGLSIMSLFDNPDYADLLVTDNPDEQLKVLYNLFNTTRTSSEQHRLRTAIAAMEYAIENKKLSKEPEPMPSMTQSDNPQDDMSQDTSQEPIEEMPIDDSKKKAIGSYGASIRASVRGLFNQEIDLISFINAMNSAIDRGFEQAWTEGALECGITRDERTTEEINQLNRMIANNKTYVFEFGDWIEQLRNGGGVLQTVFNRAEMWTNRYNEVYNQAQTMACKDAKFRWEVGPTEHCSDCSTYNGRVYRGSVWDKYGIKPQSSRLECGGYRCQCRLVKTTERANSGRPPAPIGMHKEKQEITGIRKAKRVVKRTADVMINKIRSDFLVPDDDIE